MSLHQNTIDSSAKNIINTIIDLSNQGKTFIDLDDYDFFVNDEVIKKVFEHFEKAGDEIEKSGKIIKWH